ncbi:MAG: HNH endonuclease [Muribaculaceae bacterium]
MAKGKLWSREEMILALALYFKIPYGRMNDTTPEIMALANLINRSPNSVAIRLGNFAACDPYIIASGRKGMPGSEKVCKPFWDEFVDNREGLFYEEQRIIAKLADKPIEKVLNLKEEDFIGKEKHTVVKVRINQQAFRSMILSNYQNTCAISGIDIREILVASHIVPWADDVSNRLNPENGICLSPLYDRLFDRGLITVDENYCVRLSYELKQRSERDYYGQFLAPIDNLRLMLPIEHWPDKNFLKYHCENIFAPHN